MCNVQCASSVGVSLSRWRLQKIQAEFQVAFPCEPHVTVAASNAARR